ncbi:helix-turn-helix domain-containing protein [Streptomyces werraensis]|uniref:helix-turn-helix domain-containing protein n=1 Tax=Streptomyces werraensis TaxID=68284 RepID=UPI00342BFC73
MAGQKPSAAPRPIQGVRRSATPSGVTHVRTCQSGQYVVVGNHLAQHRELSLTAIGLATHIFSVPESTPVDIRSLAERFPEGRDRIAFALREWEAHGYLRRVREHTEDGRLVTRTYAHHAPVAVVSADVAGTGRSTGRRPAGGRVRTHDAVTGVRRDETAQEGDQVSGEVAMPSDSAAAVKPEVVTPCADPPDVPVPRGPLHKKAVTLLVGLRRADERLTLSLRDVHRLVPAVVDWLERGAAPAAVLRTLTADLPVTMKHPAGVLAYRLRELLPPPLPAAPEPPPVTAGVHRPHPFQECDGCERVFRAPEPGRCRDCRYGHRAAEERGRAA